MALIDWRMVCGSEVTTFGSYESGVGLDRHPAVLATEVEIEDQRRPRSDGVAVGADFFGATTVALDFTVYGSTYEDARARRQRLAYAWRGEPVRRTPGALAQLWSHTGRVAFGRPRRFAASDDHLRVGVATATADFVMTDPNWYGAEKSSLVRFSEGSATGFKFPAVFPMMTVGQRETRELVDVTGDVPTPLVIEVRGPIVNPVVEIGPLKFEANVSLLAGQTLVVNAWPDKRTITVNGRAAAGIMSSRSTRLTAAVLKPGQYEAVLRGVSDSGTATLTVRWRDAFASW